MAVPSAQRIGCQWVMLAALADNLKRLGEFSQTVRIGALKQNKADGGGVKVVQTRENCSNWGLSQPFSNHFYPWVKWWLCKNSKMDIPTIMSHNGFRSLSISILAPSCLHGQKWTCVDDRVDLCSVIYNHSLQLYWEHNPPHSKP